MHSLIRKIQRASSSHNRYSFFIDLPLDLTILNHSLHKNGTLQISWKAVKSGKCPMNYSVEIEYKNTRKSIGPTGDTSILINGVVDPMAVFVYAEHCTEKGGLRKGRKSEVFLTAPSTTSRTPSSTISPTDRTHEKGIRKRKPLLKKVMCIFYHTQQSTDNLCLCYEINYLN